MKSIAIELSVVLYLCEVEVFNSLWRMIDMLMPTQAPNVIEKSDDIEEVNFSIENSPMAFEILSCGIYTDLVLAPIRELSTNAYDAHVEAENTEPFVIHLPNSLEPFWSIRDYGTGLPPMMVTKLYTRYFKSTKTKSNDTVGFMGLGSKSPFSYSPSFTVISYWNNVKYIYTAYKNEAHFPSITLLGEEPTNEPNGMEISFPVQKYDFWQFQEKTKEALRFFKQKPTVVGVHDFHIGAEEYLLEGDGYAITKSRGTTYIVMGNVGYEFEPKDFTSTTEELDSREKKLVNWGVHLFVDIGAVTPAASREKIKWIPDARVLVKRMIGDALVAIEKQAQESLTTAKCVWEARLALHDIKKGILGEITDIEETIEWNGQQIRDCVILNHYPNAPKMVECLSTKKDDRGYYRRRRRAAVNPNALRRWQVDSVPVDTQVIFINDLNRGGYASAKRYMDEHGIEKSIMFSECSDDFIDEVGCRHLIVKVSTLPKPPRAPRGSGGGSGQTERTMLQLWRDSGVWVDAEVDLAEGGVYFEVRRDKVKKPSTRVHLPVSLDGKERFDFVETSDLEDYVAAYNKLVDEDEELYVVRPCDVAKVTKHDGWITFYQWMQDTLKQRADLVEVVNKYLTWRSIKDHDVLSHLAAHRSKFQDDSFMVELIDIYNDLQKVEDHKQVRSFMKLNEYYNTYTFQKDTALLETVGLLDNVYPLLQHISFGYNERCIVPVIEYINIIDSKVEDDEVELKVTA